MGAALADFGVDRIETNIPFLRFLLDHPACMEGHVNTRWVETRLAELYP